MKLLSTIGGWLFGPGDGVSKVVEVADKAIHTEQERAEKDSADLESARQFAGVSNGAGWFNQFVDGVNRLVRPWVTVEILGRWLGYWDRSFATNLTPFEENLVLLVLTFWFGGRAILKDLPTAIRMMRGK